MMVVTIEEDKSRKGYSTDRIFFTGTHIIFSDKDGNNFRFPYRKVISIEKRVEGRRH